MSDCCNHGDSAGGSPAASSAEAASSGRAFAASDTSEARRRFQEFLRVVNQPGALDAHTKQAISIALAVLAKCEPCVRSHIAKARQKGFSDAEIDEAAWMAISFGGAPLMMFYDGIRRSSA